MQVNLSIVLCLLLAQSSKYQNLVNGENENVTQSKPQQHPAVVSNVTTKLYQLNATTVLTQPTYPIQTPIETKEKAKGAGRRRTISKTDNVALAAAEAADITKAAAGAPVIAASDANKSHEKLKQVAEVFVDDMKAQVANATVNSKNSTLATNNILVTSKTSNKTITSNNSTSALTTVFTKSSNSSSNSSTSTIATTSTSTTTITTSSTTTTTTTTTPKPKKPAVVYGLEDYQHLEGEEKVNVTQQNGTKYPLPPPLETPNAEPSQESNSNFPYTKSRDYIVPIMTVLFALPLAIGVVITTYRRFKDCWSTRHYQRMDFLVDGMYND